LDILALVGSPREAGNCDTLVNRVLEGSGAAGASIEKVMIADLNIYPCRGCMECRPTGKCDLEDDLKLLLDKIEHADALVVAAPIYGNHLPGQFKVLFDRLVGVMHRTDNSVPGKLTSYSRLQKKSRQLLLLAVAGAPREESCEQALSFLRRVFLPETNGGEIHELRAIGLSAKGQVGMNKEELTELVAKLTVSEPEEYLGRMLARNKCYLDGAYQLGREITRQ